MSKIYLSLNSLLCHLKWRILKVMNQWMSKFKIQWMEISEEIKQKESVEEAGN